MLEGLFRYNASCLCIDISTTCRHVVEEVEKQWSTFDRDDDGYITWKEFSDRKYGMIGTDIDSDCDKF